MPAPNATLLTAIRAANVERHIFMRLDHSQGALRYWTGLGAFSFGGETYTGIAGLARVSGVSDSADVQQHEITVTLNAVPLSALTDVDQSIRGRTADMWAVWIDATGAVVHSIKLFSGKGNRIVIKPGDDSYALEARLKANLANWLNRGDRFFTNVDQQRLFASDTGFNLVPSLQNATLTGWRRTGAAATDLIYYVANFGGTFQHFADASGVIVGHDAYGPYFRIFNGNWYPMDLSWYLVEAGTANLVTYTGVGNPIISAGSSISFSGGGKGQSINGNIIVDSLTNNVALGIRRQSTISATGTYGSEAITHIAINGISYLLRLAGNASGGSFEGLIYSNNPAYRAVLGPTRTMTINTISRTVSDVYFYTEAGAYAGKAVADAIGDNSAFQIVYNYATGRLIFAIASGVGSNYNQSEVRLSSTGALVCTQSGNVYRLTPSNGDTSAFLRRWS